MNRQINKFQLITLAIFVVFIIVGVASFALYKGRSRGTEIPGVTIWGTFPTAIFEEHLININEAMMTPLDVKYVEKTPDQFSGDFIAALARGQGPDGILIPADMLYPHEDKITPVPYSVLSKNMFQETFISEANIYLSPAGVLGVPFTVDPLIMYWNRDTFDTSGIATYPKYWDEFVTLNEKLTQKDQNGNIRRSAIAMGDFTNVANARELLATLFFQIGNPVTYRDAEGKVRSAIQDPSSKDPTPAIEFFAQAVDPSSPKYSWNRGMPNSKSAFLSGMLATYFGFASEVKDLRTKNPNINFDAALIPQLRTGGVKATYGRMYAFSLVKSSPNQNAVYQIAAILSSPKYLKGLSQSMYIPPVHRSLITEGSEDPYLTIFNEAALVSKTWLDVSPARSREILSTLVNSITSGQKQAYRAIRDAGDEYDILLRQAVE